MLFIFQQNSGLGWMINVEEARKLASIKGKSLQGNLDSVRKRGESCQGDGGHDVQI